MAASLIKLVGSGTIRYFIPSQVVKIDYVTNSSTIAIVLGGNQLIQVDTPSPANALERLTDLETAMTSATGLVSITANTATATTTTTTVAVPTTTTTTLPPE
jgi:hypothetical protein